MTYCIAILALLSLLIIARMFADSRRVNVSARDIPCSGGCGKTLPAHESIHGTLIAWTCGHCNER